MGRYEFSDEIDLAHSRNLNCSRAVKYYEGVDSNI
tara:strand:+ start:615 stop:719 length:105 start_codon:yes stop_codon:yes gene_type:complete